MKLSVSRAKMQFYHKVASAKLPHTSWQHPASAHALTWVYVSRISQLPTDVCPQFQHKWDVSIESASIATTCTYNCIYHKVASAKLPHTSVQHRASAHALTWVYVSRVSQLPTDVCPQYQNKWNVDIESASTATTCTYNCRLEWC